MEITGLKRRLLIIIYNNGNKWISATELLRILNQRFRDGLSDKYYTLNWICISLKELGSKDGLGYLTKHTEHRGGRGNLSQCKLTEDGLIYVKKSLNIE